MGAEKRIGEASIGDALSKLFDEMRISMEDVSTEVNHWSRRALWEPGYRSWIRSLSIGLDDMDNDKAGEVFATWLSAFDYRLYSKQTIEYIREAFGKIPEKYRERKIADFLPAKNAVYMSVMAGCSGLILGDNGVGKTSFLWACYKELFSRNITVQVIEARDLVNRINADRASGNSVESIIQMDWMHPRLFIDELDKARQSDASFGELIALIGKRYDAGLQTVCCANGRPETITETIPQHVYSRLTGRAEGNFGIVFGGNDRRRD